MRWDSYADYLASGVWQAKRRLALNRDGYRCQKCGTAKNLRVHHIHYPENLGMEPIEDLVTLCDSCHKRAHADEKDASLYRQMRSSSHSSGITAWQFAFIGFIEGECAKNRNLNPRKLDDIKMLREEFARLMGIDADTLSPLAVIRYETLRINHDIDTAIRDSTVSGKDRALNKLSQKGITKKHIKKRISKLLEIGAAMQIMNWTEIEPAGAGAEKLEPGAYVIRITEVAEHTSRKGDPYLTFLYDIAEGEHANHFAGETRDFTHSFNRSYTGNAQPFFRSLLDAFEQSNPGRFTVAGWQRTCDENAFVGLIVGALFRDRLYTSGRTGKDVTATDFVRAMPADDVRKGNWTVPPAKDDRDKPGVQDGYFAAPTAAQPGQAADSPYDADIPF